MRTPALIFLSLVGCGAGAEPAAPPTVAFHASTPSCAGVSLEANGHAYCVQPAEVRFDQARAACQAQGMELASIGSREENDALVRALASPLPDPHMRFWIGLGEPEEGKWVWTTEDVAGFGAWAPGEPNDKGSENCAEVIGATGTWNDAPCPEEKPYACEPRSPGEPMSCTGQRVEVGAAEICLYTSVPRSWTDAREACAASGGRLATLSTPGANAALARALSPRLLGQYLWIGATDQGVEAAFVWTDGSPWTFSGFGLGEPNNRGDGEDCTEWIAPTGAWNDLSCQTHRGALCEAPEASTLVAR